MKASLEMIFAINNLAMVSGYVTPILVNNNFALLFKDTKTLLLLDYILYIYHLIKFKNNQAKIQTLLNSDNKINTMLLVYMAKLGLKV